MPPADCRPFGGLGDSLHRHYIDDFMARQAADLEPGSLVLDLGGTRIAKRGRFDIEQYPLRVLYANISPMKRPHVQADAAAIPMRRVSVDAVTCSEVLEHVPDPPTVLAEVRRVLRPGGRLIVTVPFLRAIHGDPADYGRYTDRYWRERCTAAGLDILAIEPLGLFWSVACEMVRAWLLAGVYGERAWKRLGCRLLAQTIPAAKVLAARWDRTQAVQTNPALNSFVIGFGLVAVKG